MGIVTQHVASWQILKEIIMNLKEKRADLDTARLKML